MGKKEVNLIKLLSEFKKKVNKEFNVTKFILFGSRARKNNKKESDVDILIVSPDFEGRKSFKRSPKLYLMWNEDYEVDFICLTPEELKQKQKQISLVKDAVNKGIEI